MSVQVRIGESGRYSQKIGGKICGNAGKCVWEETKQGQQTKKLYLSLVVPIFEILFSPKKLYMLMTCVEYAMSVRLSPFFPRR